MVQGIHRNYGKIAIVADLTVPDLVSWIKESIGEGQPNEIVPELTDHQ